MARDGCNFFFDFDGSHSVRIIQPVFISVFFLCCIHLVLHLFSFFLPPPPLLCVFVSCSIWSCQKWCGPGQAAIHSARGCVRSRLRRHISNHSPSNNIWRALLLLLLPLQQQACHDTSLVCSGTHSRCSLRSLIINDLFVYLSVCRLISIFVCMRSFHTMQSGGHATQPAWELSCSLTQAACCCVSQQRANPRARV